MRTIKLLLPLLALGLFAACSVDDDATVSSDLRPVTITASVDAQMTSRATAATDDPVTRCFVQVLDANGQPLTDGECAHPLPLDKQADGSFALSDVYLDPTYSYNFAFWADGGDTYYTVSTTTLADIAIAPNQTAAGIAYRGVAAWAADSASTTISCTLTHAVAKVTLSSTTAVDASVPVAISVPREYDHYDAIAGNVTGSAATTLSHEATGTGSTGEITTFYALVDDQTQDIAIAVDNRQNAQTVGSVPLRTNSHVTISGDVAHVGLTNVSFTAIIDPTWGSQTTTNFDYDYDSSTNTYTVRTADGLFTWANAARKDLKANCILANDIDITGRAWTTIEGATNSSLSYTGTFDGASHTISGLTIDVNSTDCAFFYELNNATVKDVTFTGVSVQNNNIAATIAYRCRYSLISNCHVTGEVVSTNQAAGGFFYGVEYGSVISGCSFKGEVSGSFDVGGIAGASYLNSTIEDCRVEADITATGGNAGGIVGWMYPYYGANDTNKIVGCSFKGNVKSFSKAGGIVGQASPSSNTVPPIIACHSSGTVSGDIYIGGIVGYGTCVIKSCYTTADISSTGSTRGAIAGDLSSTGDLTWSMDNCFYQSNVTNSYEGATAVNGNTVTWQSAMDDMNAALTNAGYQWQYVDNGYSDPDNKEPLVLSKK